MTSTAFSCGFVRHQCAHDEIFGANYQRTNRTKGSKILRCVPHCCPEHLPRSFCGAPLFVDVEWECSSGAAAGGDVEIPFVSTSYNHHHHRHYHPFANVGGNTNTNRYEAANSNRYEVTNTNRIRYANDDGSTNTDLPVLVVFGRFRLQLSPAIAVGERLVPETITGSIQSEANPNGEWIPSATLYSPTSLVAGVSWRFEVNSSARWFYAWESGVAKSHRLREHVLDVVVMTPVLERDASTGEMCEWLRVVATVTSPPFKMISFRRATPAAMALLGKSSAPTPLVPFANSSNNNLSNKSVADFSNNNFSNKSVAAKSSNFSTKSIQLQQNQHVQNQNQHAASLQSSTHWFDANANTHVAIAGSSSKPHSPDPASQLDDLVTVWSAIQSVALRSVLPLVNVLAASFSRAACQTTGYTHSGSSHVPLATTLALLVETHNSHGAGRPTRPPSPLLKILVHTALWLCWNEKLHDEWLHTLDHAMHVLLDAQELRWCFENEVVVWLWTELYAFLEQMDWTLAALVAAIRETAMHRRPGAVELSGEWAFEGFVAHVREYFVDHQRRLSKRLDRLATRLDQTAFQPCHHQHQHQQRHQQQEQRQQKHHQHHHQQQHQQQQHRNHQRIDPEGGDIPRVDSLVYRLPSAFDGDWCMALDELVVHPADHAGLITDWRLVDLLWMWRQLSVLSVRFDELTSTLSITSAFYLDDHDLGLDAPGLSRSNTTSRSTCTRLVLDHRCRWFRHFPDGLSTLAASSASMGDYVGKVADSKRAIHVNCYAWPLVPPPPPLAAAAAAPALSSSEQLYATCYQIHIVAPARDGVLQVRVAVNRGAIQRRSDHHSVTTEQLETLPLRERLAQITQWQPSGSMECVYRRDVSPL